MNVSRFFRLNLILSYGRRGRPEWGKLWDLYIGSREEYVLILAHPKPFGLHPALGLNLFNLSRLARVYILINGPHGVTKMDRPVLETLQTVWEDRNRHQGVQFTLQAVLTKCDQMPKSLGKDHIHSIERDIREIAPACLLVPPILTSARIPEIGVENLRQSMIDVAKCEPPS